jgi:hypothetical protein
MNNQCLILILLLCCHNGGNNGKDSCGSQKTCCNEESHSCHNKFKRGGCNVCGCNVCRDSRRMCACENEVSTCETPETAFEEKPLQQMDYPITNIDQKEEASSFSNEAYLNAPPAYRPNPSGRADFNYRPIPRNY